ncbi:Type I restriction-modification system methyltransferase subunit|uniref:site-specific DNA-methyltransferase (adenine-specific) n=1 Tax=Brenneria salicis ATCC 15712 = DSM 30166 TaxID=714314 RepID=A0A366I606_9GAMM|nr:N-6 DNA methylase [Brenneria salicis]NMN91431.1 Type I restriction-modification system methyltransferase subunit [Brenneria salicis ATCC 15712 = DSM 30166]RBP62727.1 N-6 DNA methylase [Brenneria salicis ATCC 15712 = DSM 30166]
MPATDAVGAIRASARSFEESLPPAQRKRLGQFFTGLPLGTLLAHLALDQDCRAVIDPMAGHGDLLDAAAMTARTRGFQIDRLDGIELDPNTATFCGRRTTTLEEDGAVTGSRIVTGSAFDPSNVAALHTPGYDLVITNPPYVRYQSQNGDGAGVDDVRRGLFAVVDACVSGDERALWQTLVEGYSGLADLSVPSWLLSALLTRPGGRLALVVPATWRSRDYADVVRYLLLRFFRLDFIVADTQPGWFSDALVRTHLVVARRLPWDEAAVPLAGRTSWLSACWLQVAPEAASGASLVGGAFPGPEPERDFADWAVGMTRQVQGVESRPFALQEEWRTLEQRLARKGWFQKAEDRRDTLPLFSSGAARPAAVPEGLRDMLPTGAAPAHLQTLEQAGIRVSQGLRTGCNRFFYVKLASDDDGKTVAVEASDSFQDMRFQVPAEALRPVLHRQADMPAFMRGHLPPTRALDLSQWVLPEDQAAVARAAETYRKRGKSAPCVMPAELAAFVTRAARLAPDPKEPARFIPDLSAVRTNIRQPANGRDIPRFWYMLPAFTPRHLPAIFTPRINHGTPVVALNTQPPILIDANFSTIWPEQKRWTRHALCALFNSSWCRAAMESAGTPLGGGALKLEATHIRQVPLPVLSDSDCQTLDALGQQLAVSAPSAQHQIDMFILGAVLPHLNEKDLKTAAQHIETRLQAVCAARQRIAS